MKKFFVLLFLCGSIHAQTVQWGPFTFTSIINGVVTLSQNQLPSIVDTVGATVSNTGTLVLTVTISTSKDDATWLPCSTFAVAGSATQTNQCANQAGKYVQISLSGVNNTIYGSIFGNNSAIGSIAINPGLGYASLSLVNTYTSTQNAPVWNATSGYDILGVPLATTNLSDTLNVGYLNKPNVYTLTQTAPMFDAVAQYDVAGVQIASTNLADTSNIAYLNHNNFFQGTQQSAEWNATVGYFVNGLQIASANLGDTANIPLKNAANIYTNQNTFSAGLNTATAGVSHGGVVEINGDVWILANLYYDGTFLDRINTAKVSFALQLSGSNNFPQEPDQAATMWYAQAGTGTICVTYQQGGGCADYETTYGLQTGYTLQGYGTMVLGGDGFEFDGYGTVPYGRLLHSGVTNQGVLNGIWTGMMTNSFIDLSGTDSHTNDSWFFGIINDAYYVLQAPATTGQPIFAPVSCTNSAGRDCLSTRFTQSLNIAGCNFPNDGNGLTCVAGAVNWPTTFADANYNVSCTPTYPANMMQTTAALPSLFATGIVNNSGQIEIYEALASGSSTGWNNFGHNYAATIVCIGNHS